MHALTHSHISLMISSHLHTQCSCLIISQLFFASHCSSVCNYWNFPSRLPPVCIVVLPMTSSLTLATGNNASTPPPLPSRPLRENYAAQLIKLRPASTMLRTTIHPARLEDHGQHEDQPLSTSEAEEIAHGRRHPRIRTRERGDTDTTRVEKQETSLVSRPGISMDGLGNAC